MAIKNFFYLQLGPLHVSPAGWPDRPVSARRISSWVKIWEISARFPSATLEAVSLQLNGKLMMCEIQQAMQDDTTRDARIHPAFIRVTELKCSHGNFSARYLDPYEHIQDLEVRRNLETDPVISTGFMWRRSKAWFPYDRPDNPSRFKKIRDDPDDWDDLWFPYDRLDRINEERRRVISDVFGSNNRIFARVLQTSQT